ncbi:MAG TPA: hypothetical protein PKU77_05845 [Ferruginibacter sp.]|nr:hypothetical protein [Ferruginibacter sp.]
MFFSLGAKAQQSFHATYSCYTQITSSGLPVIYAAKDDTSRKWVLNMKINLVYADSLYFQDYQYAGMNDARHKITDSIFGPLAKHHELFFDLREMALYEYRALKRKNKHLFKSNVELKKGQPLNETGVDTDCSWESINFLKDSIQICVLRDNKFPAIGFFRGFVFHGLMAEFYWPSRNMYVKLDNVNFRPIKIQLPSVKIINNKN